MGFAHIRGILPRAVGITYLLYIGLSILSDRLGHFAFGAPEKIYATIAENGASFRLGLFALLISYLLFLLVAWGLAALFRSVNPDAAALLLTLNAVGTAVSVACALPLVAAAYLDRELALAAIRTHKQGFIAAQLFFSAWLFPMVYLVGKSRLLPRVFSALLIADGAGIFIWFFQGFLLPDFKALIYPGLAISFVAEFSLAIRLAVGGLGKPESLRPGSGGLGGGSAR